MYLCRNYVNCGNHVAKPGLCRACQEEAREIDAELDRLEEERYMKKSSGKNLEEKDGK